MSGLLFIGMIDRNGFDYKVPVFYCHKKCLYLKEKRRVS